MSSFSYIVIGAGIMGAYTAYTLAKGGNDVLLLEQFTAPNTRCSSQGKARQIFKACMNPTEALMMEEAYKLWMDLDKESQQPIFMPTGVLMFGKADSKLAQFNEYLATHKPKYEYEFLRGDEVSKKFPMFSFDEKHCCFLDKSGGLLVASVCLDLLYRGVKKHHGNIRENEGVVEVQQISNSEIRVKTVKDTYIAHGVVITAGPWANKLLDKLGLKIPLTVIREDVLYYKQKKEVPNFEIPCFLMLEGHQQLFSLPAIGLPGMAKVVFNCGSVIDPDSRVTDPDPDPSSVEHIKQFLSSHLPTISTTPMVAEKGMATFTPDRNFIIDRHPKFENIVIGAGFSGRGFQYAPVIGKLLAELVTKTEPSYNLKSFSLKRFATK